MQTYPGDEVARAAFDVMMRRGWGIRTDGDDWWPCDKRIGFHAFMDLDDPPLELPSWPDPFTAVVEADRWYRENVENKT